MAIRLDKNKIIIDSHADTVEECNTLTNLANALDASDSFKTVKYVNGYAEFESVEQVEMFMFIGGTYSLYSKDGSNSLLCVHSDLNGGSISINGNVITIRDYDDVVYSYTYSGEEPLIGVSRTPNSLIAEISVGESYSWTGGGAYDFYLVTASTYKYTRLFKESELAEEGYVIPSGVKNIYANGDHDVSGKATAHVDVQLIPNLQAKTVTPTTSERTVEADDGYDGLSSVKVGAIPDFYIVPSGSPEPITANGTYTVTAYESVTVDVPTYITAASESALPDASSYPEGTYCVIEEV